jgi:NitT/TauT family transport system permease protein
MTTKLKKTLSVILAVALWLLIWEIASRIIDLNFVLPGVIPTLRRLCELFAVSDFWKAIILSILRILLGFIIGVFAGTLLALLCNKVKPIKCFVSIFMVVAKSTPVASFIMILWVLIGSASLPSVIGVLMVMPIIWQNLMDGFDAIDNDLIEVSTVFELDRMKRFKYLIFPTLMRFFVPAALTSVGLAWKSGIAAEILTYTKNSIGKNISDAKAYFEGTDLLAWTVTVITISLAFEFLISRVARRVRNATHT